MKKKLLISVGGTGGHVFPSLALATELNEKFPEIQLLFVGGGLSSNRYFKGNTFPFKEVSCGSFTRKNPLFLLRSSVNIMRGIWQSKQIIKQYKPDLVLGFGSYYTFPTLFAAKLEKKSIVLHEANSIPGKVNRFLSRHVDVTGIHFPEAAKHLSGATVEVGLPLRTGYQLALNSKSDARRYFELDPDKITLLVFGGSQGAKAINTLFSEASVLSFGNQHISNTSNTSSSFQIIHFTGDAAQTSSIKEKYASAGIKACVKDFEPRMDLAWSAADFVISRAGASTIAEQIEFEVPGILIPYPYATDNHQEMNADFIVNFGGAQKMLEKSLDAKKMSSALTHLLKDDQKNLHEMRQAIRQYKNSTKRTNLCSLVCELLEIEAKV